MGEKFTKEGENMALTPSTVATNNITALDSLPNDVGGLTSSVFQAKFDKFGTDFSTYFNTTHLVELAAQYATNAALNAVVVGAINTVDSITGYGYAIIIENGLLGVRRVS